MIQSTFEETSEDYKAFVDKFKPKKTTDDCYTPEIISEAVNRLNRISGGESDITLGRDGMDRPYAHIRDFVSGTVNEVCDRYEYDADAVAEILGIDGEAFAWCDGGDGEFALARFDTSIDRDMWLNQI